MNKGTGKDFVCKFCNKRYQRETAYLNHECKQMLRDAEIKTPLGQSAYSYYSKWMRIHRKVIPEISVFMTSRFYTAFIKFAQYVKDVHITNTDAFIQMMKEHDFSPFLWTNDQVYALYVEYIDRRSTPLQQVKMTIDTLFSVADELECGIEQVFNRLHPNEIMQLLRERRISPWLLLRSTAFKVMLTKCTPEQQTMFESLIRPMYWTQKFNKNPEIVKLMNRYVDELGI